MRRRLAVALLLVLASTPAWAQRTSGDRGPQDATPIRCVNIGGTAFEACGGGAGGGVTDTDDNSIAFAQTPGLNIALTYVSNGAVWSRLVFGQTTMSASLPVTFASDQSALHTICDSGCGSPPATADGTAFTFGTTNVSPVAFVVDDVASTTVTENSYGAARMSGSRILYFDLSKTTANATAIKVDGSAVTQPVSATNLDVALSTRLKPADTLAAVTTVGTITNVVHVDDNAGSLTIDNANLDVALSTRLKPADTLAAVTTVGTITNVVHVDDNAGSLTVDGTVAATQSGTWTVQPGNTANTTPWLFQIRDAAGNARGANVTAGNALVVDGSAVTQPVSGTVAVSNSFLLDATFTGRMPAGASPANGESNTIAALSRIGSFNYIYNGSTWDRWTGAVTGSGNFTVTQGTGTNLHMVCDSGCSSSAGFADNAAFTYGTTAINPIGGVLDDVNTNAATEDSAAVVRITALKAEHVNLRGTNGGEIGTMNAPVVTTPALASNVAPRPGPVILRDQFGRALGTAAAPITTVSATAVDPCQGATVDSVNISQTTNTLLVARQGARYLFICSYTVVGADAENLSFVEGTGTTCGTGTAAVVGGATAAAGMNFAANGGASSAGGPTWIARTHTAGTDLCLLQSGSGRVAGSLKYAFQ